MPDPTTNEHTSRTQIRMPDRLHDELEKTGNILNGTKTTFPAPLG